ncbi:outer membrane lipoprotein carrier protein LolA [Fluviicola sp.]|jgi:outer membrane lipoprotein-sorting protein|uniref:LolA family protein n=1 Tax=Fluviicola sp. TaxID=1917219 RepID=UPI00281752B0|nr:outer membrane lipoprotein carrier protein LolA [Fluviicola sp.]MDR0802863.1 outer membrane lipoprotein carrier protein LolA [Fluviicola sp.]
MKYLIICLTLLGSTLSYSQDPKADAILDKVSAKIKELKTFYVEFSAIIKNSTNGTNSNLSGKGWVKGDKYCATYGETTLISNGLKTWSIVKEEKTVYETDASSNDEESINPKKLMTIWETGFKSKYDKEEVLNGEKVHVIYLYPKNPKKANYHTIIIYISKDDNELKKAIMKSNDGTVSTFTMTKLTPNPTIEDSKFVFDKSKYPGYTVVKD